MAKLGEIYKASKRKTESYTRKPPLRLSSDFSAETLKPKRVLGYIQSPKSEKAATQNKFGTAKLSFIIEGERSFQQENKRNYKN